MNLIFLDCRPCVALVIAGCFKYCSREGNSFNECELELGHLPLAQCPVMNHPNDSHIANDAPRGRLASSN